MAAVDQPNSSTPFMAVNGPSSRQRSAYSVPVAKCRVVDECELQIGAAGRHLNHRVGYRPKDNLGSMRGHQN